MVNMRTSLCDSTGSKSKKYGKICMQTWNVILQNFICSLDWVAPAERFLYGWYWDSTTECKVPWGYLLAKVGPTPMKKLLNFSQIIALSVVTLPSFNLNLDCI